MEIETENDKMPDTTIELDTTGYFKTRRMSDLPYTKSSLVQRLERQFALGQTPDYDIAVLTPQLPLQKAITDAAEKQTNWQVKNSQSRAFHVELNKIERASGAVCDAGGIYERSSVEKLKRSARALARQNAEDQKENVPGLTPRDIAGFDEKNYVTSDCLPEITAPLQLSAGRASTDAIKRGRRELLPPARTRVLGASQPSVLLGIISGAQDRRARELARREEEMIRLAEYRAREAAQLAKRTRLDLKALTTRDGLRRLAHRGAKKLLNNLARLIDRLALA